MAKRNDPTEENPQRRAKREEPVEDLTQPLPSDKTAFENEPTQPLPAGSRFRTESGGRQEEEAEEDDSEAEGEIGEEADDLELEKEEEPG